MAREKKIKRTIITGYKYDVLEKGGEGFKIIGQVVTPEPVRSVKETKNVLILNEYDENCTLVQNGIEQKSYEMPEAVFMEHATVVNEI